MWMDRCSHVGGGVSSGQRSLLLILMKWSNLSKWNECMSNRVCGWLYSDLLIGVKAGSPGSFSQLLCLCVTISKDSRGSLLYINQCVSAITLVTNSSGWTTTGLCPKFAHCDVRIQYSSLFSNSNQPKKKTPNQQHPLLSSSGFWERQKDTPKVAVIQQRERKKEKPQNKSQNVQVNVLYHIKLTHFSSV